ncbi:substrate-binding periplasmic protein [Chromobacterium alticapitis]|uniref:ABC transporter substrate-binding protein n=1 Tax=Chromobacterium alticapitis TaxID=2073169 RepID=A0A2S5DKN2_9NEIS|nr:transporter substrate-binding domain-containing protein [Chromobacterium alticapitis]POZ63606.1 ABC transporter substrate-binding protein [Chromobacterium alticapitis]
MRLFAALLVWIAAAPCMAMAAQTVVILTDNDYAPYSYEASGQARGIYNDILRAAAARLPAYRVELRPVPWKRGLAELEAGRALALSPPYFKPHDRPYIQPYSVPMLTERVQVYCRAEVLRQPRPNWPDDYQGLRFGNNAGFKPGGDAFWKLVSQGKISLEEAANVRANLLKLLRGRLDCYLNDGLAIQLELARLQRQRLYAPGQLAEAATASEEQGYVGFTDRDDGRFPYKRDFLEQLNRVLGEMRKSGQIDRIVERALQAARQQDAPLPF